jgi:hypothetical protein
MTDRIDPFSVPNPPQGEFAAVTGAAGVDTPDSKAAGAQLRTPDLVNTTTASERRTADIALRAVSRGYVTRRPDSAFGVAVIPSSRGWCSSPATGSGASTLGRSRTEHCAPVVPYCRTVGVLGQRPGARDESSLAVDGHNVPVGPCMA